IPLPKYDPEKAKAMLKAAGYTKPVSFELLVTNQPLLVRVAEMMQSMVAEAGFDMKLKLVDFVTSLNMTDSGDFQAWGPIGKQYANDPDVVSYPILKTGGTRNVGKYANADLDRLLEGTRTELDPAKRNQLFRDADAIIDRDHPDIFLYHLRTLFAASSRLTI